MTRSYEDESETVRELRDRASISRSSHVGIRASLPAKDSTQPLFLAQVTFKDWTDFRKFAACDS